MDWTKSEAIGYLYGYIKFWSKHDRQIAQWSFLFTVLEKIVGLSHDGTTFIFMNFSHQSYQTEFHS